MIINQTIKDGFATINKTGAYFSLITAPAVVRVRLSNRGRVVLDSDMWVGMNIPQALPFDEINIFGVDGRIEFWAGDVAMNQNGSMSFRGANAVRSSKVDVLGATQLTGSDITRQAVRIRANQDLYIGGAGVNGDGWRIQANVMEELPISGVLYGYKKLPTLDLANAVVAQEYTFPASISSLINRNDYHISPDNQTVLILESGGSGYTSAQISTDGGSTFAPPSWVGDAELAGAGYYLIYHYSRQELYLLVAQGSSKGGVNIFKSTDEGVTFSYFMSTNALELVDISYLNFSPYAYFVGSKMYFSAGMAWWCFIDLDTLEISGAQKKGSLTAGIVQAVPEMDGVSFLPVVNHTSSDGQRLIVGISSPVKKTLFSDNGGASFSVVVDDYLSVTVGKDPVNLCGLSIYSSIYPYFSNDGGQSFVKVDEFGAVANKAPANFIGDMWVYSVGGVVNFYYQVAGQYKRASESVAGAPNSNAYFAASGDLINEGWVSSDPIKRISLGVEGDLSPVSVEVLELLN
ncbi:hypothetical protein [Shewanella baltica]|uniref:hypothetical protein n=1 Tax=Shewanella baltica TaxID=62322 RepID=UPI003D7AF726